MLKRAAAAERAGEQLKPPRTKGGGGRKKKEQSGSLTVSLHCNYGAITMVQWGGVGGWLGIQRRDSWCNTHCSVMITTGKGPCTYDVHKIFGILDPPPPCPHFTQPISLICPQNWVILEPPLRADVICTWSLIGSRSQNKQQECRKKREDHARITQPLALVHRRKIIGWRMGTASSNVGSPVENVREKRRVMGLFDKEPTNRIRACLPSLGLTG